VAVVEGREHFQCPYCDSFVFPGDLESSIDRIKPLGQSGERTCPVCSEALQSGTMEGRTIEYCTLCRGVLLSSDDFLQIVRLRRAQRTQPPDEPRPLNQEEMNRHVECPVCGKRMEVHPYYGGGSVMIDSCRACGMVWLDHGEITVIERAPGRR